jgi:hypothetical protein
MMLIGLDYHPSFQTIAFLIEETGECGSVPVHRTPRLRKRFHPAIQVKACGG